MDGIVLETEQLFLCEWSLKDFDAFKAIATNPTVMQFIGTGALWSDDRIQQWIEKQIFLYTNYQFCNWVLIDKMTQAFMGFCGLQPFNQEIEIGWWLAPEYWGKGFATESAQAAMADGFNRLNLSRIVSIAQPANHRSIRVMEKLGMQFEKMSTDLRGIEVVYYAKNRPAG
ncbi:GNAT family N-acetyltransferase [Leptolyngbya sp. FACHB-36]|uniref:GNAT family N-acetyltransferase n=1 Tax=Leptolyngbya sp. FACHB-36 TaxID=2692808 RepID=UPI001680EC03|nr:GNAT family N-acetyltransferase [Leptolyngbya sp. FACHB-36]MBD2020428.1 GNAT family N-acetyltransferase [Leptolyngbya sp. FACHB-36]